MIAQFDEFRILDKLKKTYCLFNFNKIKIPSKLEY